MSPPREKEASRARRSSSKENALTPKNALDARHSVLIPPAASTLSCPSDRPHSCKYNGGHTRSASDGVRGPCSRVAATSSAYRWISHLSHVFPLQNDRLGGEWDNGHSISLLIGF